MIDHSPEINEISAALAKAQGEFPLLARDLVVEVEGKRNYSYAYADLGACLDAIRKPMTDNGLAVLQSTRTESGDVMVYTTIVHSSGQWIDFGNLLMTPMRPGPQAIGSCITYARRYALAAALGLAQTDDDANSAEGSQGATGSSVGTKSMSAAVKLIDEIEDGDYQLFKATWASLDKAVRDEIVKRKPKQMELWKEVAYWRAVAEHDGNGGQIPQPLGAEVKQESFTSEEEIR